MAENINQGSLHKEISVSPPRNKKEINRNRDSWTVDKKNRNKMLDESYDFLKNDNLFTPNAKLTQNEGNVSTQETDQIVSPFNNEIQEQKELSIHKILPKLKKNLVYILSVLGWLPGRVWHYKLEILK